MQARMKNPVHVLPEALQALLALGRAAEAGGVPPRTLELVHLRTSQVNGCSVCVDAAWRKLRQAGETDERIFGVTAWRDMPYYSAAERAALALAEAVTRLEERVPDGVWDEAARHYDDIRRELTITMETPRDPFPLTLAAAAALRGLGAGIIAGDELITPPERRRLGPVAYATFVRAHFKCGASRHMPEFTF